MKKVLFAASEAVPFIKTGGLTDVVGSLPKAYNRDEFDVRVVLPKYRVIPEHFQQQMEYDEFLYQYVRTDDLCRCISDDAGWRDISIFIDNEYYFSGDRIYEEDCGILRSFALLQ